MKKLLLFAALFLVTTAEDCDGASSQAQAASGVKQTSTTVATNAQGLTAEQQNVRDRLIEDNKPGAIKHLYVISAYSGQVLLYSTVRGKVTSSGKRLSPTSVAAGTGNNCCGGYDFQGRHTSEVLQDDGTYGTSVDYVYWWDTKGTYFQHYVTGGEILVVTSQPMAVKGVVMNVAKDSGR